MTGQENKRPNELIEHAPVTLRRFRAEDADALFAVTDSLDQLRPWMPWQRTQPRLARSTGGRSELDEAPVRLRHRDRARWPAASA